MKNIITRLVLLLCLGFIFTKSANAQFKKPSIMLGGNFIYSMPRGQFKDAYQFGLGGEIYGGVGVGSTYLTGSLGVAAYKRQSGFSNTLTSVPVKVGLKKYLLLKKLFINGDIGTTNIKVAGTSNSAFTAGFGGGVKILGLEAGLYYNAFKNSNKGSYTSSGFSNSLNLKIGWSFSL